MPVNRVYIPVQTNRQIQPTQTANISQVLSQMAAASQGNPWNDALAGQLQAVGRMAGRYAQGLAATAEEEARALAKRATFSTGPNGMPQMPDEDLSRMGNIGRRTFNALVEDNYANMMRTAIDRSLNEARMEHPYDVDAFTAAATARLERLSQDVPVGFEAMFQMMSAGRVADLATSVGYDRANLDRRQAVEAIPTFVQHGLDSVAERIRAGDEQGARTLLADVYAILDKAPLDAPPNMISGLRLKIDATVAAERIIHDAGANDMSAFQLAQLERAIAERDPDMMAEYFTPSDGYAPSDDLIAATAKRINELQVGRREAEAARLNAEEQIAQVEAVMRGEHHGSTSEAHAVAADVGIARVINRTNPITVQDWLTADDKTRALMIRGVKDAGVLPDSLKRLLNSLEAGGTINLEDAGKMAKVYGILADLEAAPNSSGIPTQYAQWIGERTMAAFVMAQDMRGTGRPTDIEFTQALANVETLLMQDPKFDDKDLAGIMAKYTAVRGGILGTSFTPITEENARSKLRSDIGHHVFANFEVPTEVMDQAERLAVTFLRMNNSYDDTIKLVEQMMESRYTESKYFANSGSYQAPETYYPDRTVNWWGAVQEVFSSNGPTPNLRLMGEWIGERASIPSKLLQQGMMAPNVIAYTMMGYRVPIADDEATIAWSLANDFDRLAHAEIQKHILAMPDGPDKDALRFGNEFFADGFLKPGEDYVLIEQPNTGNGPPVYRVAMRGANGFSETLKDFTLDVREPFRRLNDIHAKIDVGMAHIQRLQKYAKDNGLQFDENLVPAFLTAVQNNDLDYMNELIRQMEVIIQGGDP